MSSDAVLQFHDSYDVLTLLVHHGERVRHIAYLHALHLASHLGGQVLHLKLRRATLLAVERHESVIVACLLVVRHHGRSFLEREFVGAYVGSERVELHAHRVGSLC